MINRVLVGVLLLAVMSHTTMIGGARQGIHKTQMPVFSGTDEVIPGVVIVQFNRGITISEGGANTISATLTQLLASSGVSSLRRVFKGLQPATESELRAGQVDLSRVYYGDIPSHLDPRDVARELSQSADIDYAEPKYMSYLYDTPNDPQLSNQSNAFTRMNAFNGWTIAKGDSTVAIATVDGGTYWVHEDLIGNVWINSAEDINHNGRFDPGPPPAGDEDGIDQDGNTFVDDVVGWNFANNTNNPQGLPGTPNSAAHGTATASHFGARTNNGVGMAGSSWNCALLPVCAASPTSDNGIAFGYEGIAYAFRRGAKVINCSWGRTGGYSFFEQSVINAATQAGALVVVSAGNGTNNNGIGKNNDLSPDYPASYANALPVGSTNSTSDTRASFSNYGVNVPVYAPGVSIWSAMNGGGYGNGGNGTSYSSPLTAGLAGILKSYHPTWTPRQIATQIRVTADSIDAMNPGTSGKMGRGRVNFARALSESHPGIEIVNATIVNHRGNTLYLPNDTIVITVTVQNILFTAANNLAFSATTTDASLSVVQGTANVGNLAPGQQATLTPLRFVVGALTVSKNINIKLVWLSNTNDRDAYAFKVTVFPAVPLWETQASQTSTALFSVKAVNANVAWACGGNSSATAPVVIRTTDGGSNWTVATGNLTSADLYCVTALDANRAWVGTGNLGAVPGKIFATSNGGVSWTQQTYPGTQSPFMNGIWMLTDGTGYAMGDPASGGVFVVLKTTNFGQSWVHTTEPVGGASEAGWNNSFWLTDANHIWFGTNASRVWRSTDGGTSWLSGASGSTNSYTVAFKDNNTGLVGHDNGVIRTTVNGGATWTSISSPTSTAIQGMAYVNGTNSAWISAGAIPYRSINNGNSWTNQTVYPISGTFNHISFVDTSIGWGVTSNGEVVRYRAPGATAVEPTASVPDGFALEQNYPNPFNPRTVIRFRINEQGMTSLNVFDLLGKLVATLVQQEMKVGTYSITFDASQLPSGVYFYTLRSGALLETKRLMVLK